MGDFPGTGEAETAPETSQTAKLLPSSPDQLNHDHHPASPTGRTPTQLKRSSLPPRPHGAARHAKRLTLNFPINIPSGPEAYDPSLASPGSMTPVTRTSAHQSPVPHLGTPLAFEEKDDGSGLLTAIASQERKVLELREELNRAETELDSLKKQWASAEKTKKRTEISHRAEPLVSLRSPDEPTFPHRRDHSVSSAGSSSAAQVRLSRELERRQSLRAAATKGTNVSANGRRVFRGSHTRALSLLSPTTGSGEGNTGSESEAGSQRIGRSPRSATLPSSVERSAIAGGVSSKPADDMISQWRNTMPPPSRDALVRTGKQMASDLKEGLWTFLEDIRQATVGEEGISATESRGVPPVRQRVSSSSTSRSRDRLSVYGGTTLSRSSSGSKGSGSKHSGKDSKSADIDSSFWSEFGIDPPGQKSPRARGAATTPSGPNEPRWGDHSNPPDVEDNWEWESPKPKKTHTPSSSRSTLETKHDQSPMTQNSSPRTSASFGDWRPLHDSSIPDPSVSDGIPWPAMTKLAPSKLTRTASNLMAEWERSLSPSPERREFFPDKDDKRD
ncbi:hypothetical protein BO86DRAFT_321667 [Aspergillus japonicus CBS 114.51]|uniref:DUF4048 domain-containing protein n=2 Tax=Aspergillus TaxID=5052 RepID=A0A2V5H4B2_ASPV1|nr:hypothetical protein BO86DRAFT_321667 [Aspergillus japonicus CBS 114.51]PYI16434.1 hypothetical protein BO99DRAFT_424721 [Aspergillus violaceofuscus CBS 115571]RAH78062.1 hypothetical protein BO86DRAFT_321667 [Aspergillus japonicus CBS 114.51]